MISLDPSSLPPLNEGVSANSPVVSRFPNKRKPLPPIPHKRKPLPPIPVESPKVAEQMQQVAMEALTFARPMPPLKPIKGSSVQTENIQQNYLPDVQSQATGGMSTSEPPKVWHAVKLLALKMWGAISEKGKQRHEDYVSQHLAYRSRISSDHTEALLAKSAYTPNLNNASYYPAIDIVLPANVERTPFVAHTAAAKQGFSKGNELYHEVAEKVVAGIGTLIPYGYRDGKVNSGTIVPTSNWLGNSKKEDHNHMMNIYIIRPKEEKTAVIRSAVIDTQQKADELVELLTALCLEIRSESGNENYQLRVVSEQLNSFDFGRESQLINHQHTWLAFANAKLKEGKYGELVHISTPTNVWYFITQKIRKLGIVGKLLEKHVFNGEMRSKELNLDSWGTYVRWTNEKLDATLLSAELAPLTTRDEQHTVEDLLTQYTEKTKDISATTSDLQETVNALLMQRQEIKAGLPALKTALKDATTGIHQPSGIDATANALKVLKAVKELNAAEASLKENRQTIKATRARLREQLVLQHQQLITLEAGLREEYTHLFSEQLVLQHQQLTALEQGLREEYTHLLESEQKNEAQLKALMALRKPVSLMAQMLGSQLDIPTASLWHPQRSTKSSRLREILLLQALHDELGVVSAGNCKSGLDRTGMWHAAVLALKQLKSANVDTLRMTDEWDTASKALNIKINELGPDKFATWLNDTTDGDPAEKRLYREIIEFRKMVLDNLMVMGLPMTERSTGLQGFKWSPGGIGENLMPLNLLPSHAKIENELVPLVKYGKKGQVKGLTPEGIRVLAKFEDIRAS